MLCVVLGNDDYIPTLRLTVTLHQRDDGGGGGGGRRGPGSGRGWPVNTRTNKHAMKKENGLLSLGEQLIISFYHIYIEYVYLKFITNMYYGSNV